MMDMELADTFTRETSVQEREDCTHAGTRRDGAAGESGGDGARRDSEELFYAQLGRGASALMLRSSAGSTQPLVEPFVVRDDYDGVARRDKGQEDADDEGEETADYGKAKEAVASDGGDDGDSEEKLIAEQMRRDEAMARQLQIQFLREEAGFVDDGASVTVVWWCCYVRLSATHTRCCDVLCMQSC
jgi:hypothetical protein